MYASAGCGGLLESSPVRIRALVDFPAGQPFTGVKQRRRQSTAVVPLMRTIARAAPPAAVAMAAMVSSIENIGATILRSERNRDAKRSLGEGKLAYAESAAF